MEKKYFTQIFFKIGLIMFSSKLVQETMLSWIIVTRKNIYQQSEESLKPRLKSETSWLTDALLIELNSGNPQQANCPCSAF